jgi:hypothetical protein
VRCRNSRIGCKTHKHALILSLLSSPSLPASHSHSHPLPSPSLPASQHPILCISYSHIYAPLSPSLFSFHASNTMDTADLEVMSCPPFDPAADVRITHTVQQGRTTGGDGDNHSRGTILNHYLRGPSVGKGQHGTVYKCWDLAQNSVEVVRLSSSISFPPHLPSSPPPYPSCYCDSTSCVPDGCLYIMPPCLSPLLGHQSRVAP